MFQKHKVYEGEVPLASTKGIRVQGGDRVALRVDATGNARIRNSRSVGRKGYVVLTQSNIYWIGLRGSCDVSGLYNLTVPQQFLSGRTRVPIPGGSFLTRHFRAVHIRRFIELNNLLARSQTVNSVSTPQSTILNARPSNNIPDEIAKLAALKDQGHITPEEYERKKTELLGRL